jgi:hypothetical protein
MALADCATSRSSCRPPFALDQPQPLQARVSVLADDDVIVHGNAERGCDIEAAINNQKALKR